MTAKMEHLTRQFDLIPMDVLSTPITVVGAGAVGSFTVLSLAKMGFNDITVYDDDTIDIENMNCQFYRFSDIGTLKVVALAKLVEDFTGIQIEISRARADRTLRPSGILIVAVDSMEARAELWTGNEYNGRLNLFIDPRMAAEEVAIRAIEPLSDRAKAYPASLHTDSDGVQEPCTAKATMYTSLLISGLLCNTVKRYLCNDEYPFNQRYAIGVGDLEVFNT